MAQEMEEKGNLIETQSMEITVSTNMDTYNVYYCISTLIINGYITCIHVYNIL